VTHDVLDELAAGKTLDHLRAVLVAGGMLPDRDERLVTLERWTAWIVASRDDHEERAMLHRYAVSHHLRRLRGRLGAGQATHLQMANVRSHITAAVNFLDWLVGRGLILTTCTQPDLDQWKAGEDLSYRDQTGHFIRWATMSRLAKGLTFGAERWQGPVWSPRSHLPPRCVEHLGDQLNLTVRRLAMHAVPTLPEGRHRAATGVVGDGPGRGGVLRGEKAAGECEAGVEEAMTTRGSHQFTTGGSPELSWLLALLGA
jgi:hypothetical protein